jgi:hypothetical protein
MSMRLLDLPTFRSANPMRERRRSAAMSLHDRPVAPVRLRFPRADVTRHTPCQPAGHSIDCGRRAPKRVHDGSGASGWPRERRPLVTTGCLAHCKTKPRSSHCQFAPRTSAKARPVTASAATPRTEEETVLSVSKRDSRGNKRSKPKIAPKRSGATTQPRTWANSHERPGTQNDPFPHGNGHP